MIIDEQVSVGLVNNIPKYVLWKGRTYKINQVGFHHTYLQGETLCHIFSVVSGSVFFKINFNTKDLSWKLEEISDAI